MDYTTIENVKQVLGADTDTDDLLLARLITEASRAIDRVCSRSSRADHYFELIEVENELLMGDVDVQGRILCRPMKPLVVSVANAEYRASPMETWQTVQADRISINGYAILLWLGIAGRGKKQVRLTYTGGLASSPEGLPADIVNAADVLAVRFYKEIKSGLTDAIGVAELGEMVYTKAFPSRVLEMLKPYSRPV